MVSSIPDPMPSTHITYTQAGVSCFVGQKSGIFKVLPIAIGIVGSSVVKKIERGSRLSGNPDGKIGTSCGRDVGGRLIRSSDEAPEMR